jgi:signal peptidase II
MLLDENMKKKLFNFFINMPKASLLLLVSLFCVGCDQTTKFTAQRVLEPDSVTKLLGGTIRIQLAQNEGSFLGLGSSLPAEWKLWIFVILVAIILVILLIYYFHFEAGNSLSTLSLSLIISGGFSNLIDRIIHDGIVIDFFNIGIGNLRTGILNIADVSITSGIVLLLVSFFLKKNQEYF